MASIIEAVENVVQDKHSFIKCVFYAIPVVGAYKLFSIGNMPMFYFLSVVTILMLMTIVIKVFRNIRENNNAVLPSFNLFTFIWSAFKLIFALGPITALCIWGGIKLTQIQIPIPLPNMQIIYSVIVWLILGGIIVTALILYSKKESLKDAYNLKLISDNCISVLFALLLYIPQIAILNGLLIGSIVYLLYVFKQPMDHIALIIVSALSICASAAITGDYFAQIDYEATFDKNS